MDIENILTSNNITAEKLNLTSNDFVHLHVHSSYSILDGVCKPKDLAKKAKKLGMSSIAITDHTTTGHITDVPHTEEADISPTAAHHTEEVPMAMATAATEYIVAAALPAEEAQGLHRHRHQQGAAPSATTQAVVVTSVTAAPMEEAAVLHEAAVLSAIAARHAAAAHSVTVVHSAVAAHAAVAVASAVVAHAAAVHTVAEEDNA